MRRLGLATLGRVGALALGIATIVGCGDNGISPPDAPDIDAPPPAPAVLSIAPSSNDFGSVVIGNTSAAATFTITNSGEADSGTITPVISGANASEFTAANGCSTLAGGGTCTITVTFTPAAAGTKAASLVVNASPGGTVMATLLATGQTPGTLEISPSSLAFGNVVTGTASATQTFTITNAGSVDTSALTVTKAGSDPAEFTKGADDCDGMTLAGGASCTIEVGFTPTSAGNKAASFVISASTGGSVNGAVTGNGQAPADLAITPTFQDFGSVTTGTSSGNITFTISNAGGVPTSAVSHSFTGTDATQFTLFNSTCNGVTLNPGATCTITVRFSPTTVGQKSAALSVTAATGGTENADLVGDGVAPGSLEILPSPHVFDPTTVGQTSTTQIFTVENTGGSPTGALGTALGGADPSQFTIVANSNGCQGVVLAPSASCTIAVIFAPTSGGLKSANLTVTHSGGSTAANLSGIGISPAEWTLTPASRDYGSVVTGTDSSFQRFVLENVGGQPSGVPAVAINGANASEFNFAGAPAQPCPAVLAPGETCDIDVRFSPATQGAKTATLNVTGMGGPVASGLSGNGVAQAALSVNPSIINFPTTLIGDSSMVESFTVTNDGSVNTGVLTVQVIGTDFSQTNNCTDGAGPGVDFLIPGASCIVTVTFTPTTRGLRSATVQISGAPGGTVGTAVNGNALPRLEIIAPTPVEFPTSTFAFDDVFVDPDAPQEIIVTIRNNTSVGQNLVTNHTFPGGHFSTIGTNGCEPAGTIDIAAGGTCSFRVEFHPQMAGDFTGTSVVTIAGSAAAEDAATQEYTGSGNLDTLVMTDAFSDAIANQLPDTTPDAHAFPMQGTGSSSNLRFFRVTNRGMMETGILTASISSTPAGAFQITTNSCTASNDGLLGTANHGGSLSDNDACYIGVIFTPLAPMSATATLTVHATQMSALGGTVTATLNGTGMAPTAVFAPTNIDFGTVFAGTNPNPNQTITITNPNDNATTLTFSITDDPIAGTDFARNGGTCPGSGGTLGAAQSCTLIVSFNARLPVGGRAGFVTLSESFGGNSAIIPLAGMVASTITITSAPLTFSNIVQGASNTQMVTVTNNAASGQTLGTFQINVSPNPTQYAILTGDCPSGAPSLAPGDSCTFSIIYTPTTSPATHNTTITVSASRASPTEVTGAATQAVAANSITPANLERVETLGFAPNFGFGTAFVGQPGTTRTFTFINVGQQTSGPITAALPMGEADYTIMSNDCTTLALNATCTVVVQFTPASAGTQTSTLTVSATPGGPNVTTALTGNAVVAGGVIVTPGAHVYPAATIGTTGTSRDFTVQNTSTTVTHTLTIRLRNPATNAIDTANYTRDTSVANNCGTTLAPGVNCTVRYTFTPVAPAALKDRSLQIQGASAGTTAPTVFAAISGLALSPASVACTGTNSFAATAINTTVTNTWTCTNSGQTASGNLTTVIPVTADSPHFGLVTNGCHNMSLAPGATCTFGLQFAPTTTGTKNATLTITGASGSTGITGLAVNPALLSITPSADFNFGEFVLGDNGTAARTYTIQNTGTTATTGPLVIAMGGANPGDFSFFTQPAGTAGGGTCHTGGFQTTGIPGGGSCTVNVYFNPKAVAVRTGILQVSATPGMMVSANVGGTGLDALVYVPSFSQGAGYPSACTATSPCSFGAAAPGAAGSGHTISFRNAADHPTSLIRTTLTDMGSYVIVNDTCSGRSLAADDGNTTGAENDACFIVVQFVPQAPTGTRPATITIDAEVLGVATTSTVSLTATVN